MVPFTFAGSFVPGTRNSKYFYVDFCGLANAYADLNVDSVDFLFFFIWL